MYSPASLCEVSSVTATDCNERNRNLSSSQWFGLPAGTLKEQLGRLNLLASSRHNLSTVLPTPSQGSTNSPFKSAHRRVHLNNPFTHQRTTRHTSRHAHPLSPQRHNTRTKTHHRTYSHAPLTPPTRQAPHGFGKVTTRRSLQPKASPPSIHSDDRLSG